MKGFKFIVLMACLLFATSTFADSASPVSLVKFSSIKKIESIKVRKVLDKNGNDVTKTAPAIDHFTGQYNYLYNSITFYIWLQSPADQQYQYYVDIIFTTNGVDRQELDYWGFYVNQGYYEGIAYGDADPYYGFDHVISWNLEFTEP